MEIVMFCILIIIQWIRLFLGNVGSKAAASGAMLWFVIISVGVCFGQFFLLLLQTYVYLPWFDSRLLLEIVIGSVATAFTVIELLLSVLAMGAYSAKEKEA
eukprot:TRINITY_DN9718_c0_g2_i1.p1 TRINITY_DN9718_c0_g2~~TRINITY_DN9718_c0_g2_i1.p1  ORF type:complete len:101 (+),score=9.22 TRINITY_DN9718_c0_g2_i1:304-606(+)